MCTIADCTGTAVFNANTPDTFSAFSRPLFNFYNSSVLNASAGSVITGGTQNFWATSTLNATAASAINGGNQIFNVNSTLNASAANAISSGTRTFTGDSTLNASVADAIVGGTQEFYDRSVLNASAANAVNGGTYRFFDDSVLNATATGAVNSTLTLVENARLNVRADNALTAATQINFNNSPGGSGGVLALNGFSTTAGRINTDAGWTGSGLITNDGATDSVLSLRGASSSNFSGIIQDGSGAGKLGLTLATTAGLVTLSGGNTYTGGTTVNGGILRAGAAGALVNNTAYVVNGGTLDLNGNALTMKSLSGTGGTVALGSAALTVDQSADTTFAGVFTGSGGLTKSATGALTLTGNSSAFTGATTLQGGTLVLGGVLGGNKSVYNDSVLDAAVAGALGSGAHTFYDDSRLKASVTGAVGSSYLTLKDNAALDVLANNALTSTAHLNFDSAAGGVGGTLRLNGYSTTVGYLRTENPGAGLITNGGATDSVLTVDNSIGLTFFSGLIQDGSGGGRLGLTLAAGNLTLSGQSNSYTGGTTVNGGTLRANTAGAFVANTDYAVNGGILYLGGFPLTMKSLSGMGGTVAVGATTLTVDQATDTTFAGVFAGTGGLAKSGAGTLTLTGDASAFSGDTMISGGALRINGVLGGDVAARTAGIVTGAGRITGDVDLTGGGVLAGAAGQTLRIDGAAVMDGTSVVNVALGAPSNTRLFDVGGNLTLDGTLNVTNAGSFGGGIYRLFDYGGTLADNGLDVGTVPGGLTGLVQTSVANRVNLLVASGTPGDTLFWNGTTTLADGTIHGGNGVWSAGPATNWTDVYGVISSPWSGKFAVFQNNPGTVTIDDAAGPVATIGMQFIGSGWTVTGDPVTLNGAGGATTIRVGDGTVAGAAHTATIASELTGASRLVKDDYGTLILTGANSYTGGTTVANGVLRAGAAGAFVNNSAYTVNGGTLDLGGFPLTMSSLSGTGGTVALGAAALTVDQAENTSFAGAFSGSGAFTKTGLGTLTLTGNSSAFTGGTTIAGGTLRVNGVLGGDVLARTSGALTGVGRITGDADLTGGGVLAGAVGQALRIDGNAVMDGTSVVNVALGGVSNTALVDVGGDLTLAGTLNVTDAGGFGAGVYRLFDYGGTLTNGGLAIGGTPTGAGAADLALQTSVPGRVNLISSAGAELGFWDGGNASLHGNGVIDGGAGVWLADDSNWTQADGALNGSFRPNPTFAIFQTIGGVVTVDASARAIGVTGMQFAADGYRVQGGAIVLQGTGGQTVIRIGDGSVAGADMSATVASSLTGASSLVKSDRGTLILTGANSYTGDTLVQAGTLIGNTGSIRGNIGSAGRLVFDQGVNGTFAGSMAGLGGTDGAMVKRGIGELILTGTSTLDWTVEAGGLTTAANRFTGDATIQTGASLTFDQSTDATYAGILSGSGAFNLSGSGNVTLTGNSSAFAGTTTVDSGNRLIVGTAAGGALGGSLTIGSGGLLGGTGTIGSTGSIVTIAAGAVHAPGNSIGVQIIAGDYVNHGTLRLEATPTGADKIVVAGSVDIAGTALDLVLSPTDASSWNVFNGPFTFIDKQSSGTVIGTFDPVTKNLLFLDAILDYAGGDGNDVTLQLERNDLAFARVGDTRNQIATATAIDTLDNSNPVWRSIALTNDSDIVRASFDELSGEIHASAKTALIEDSRFIRNAVSDRLRAAFDSVGAGTGAVMTYGDDGPQTSAATTDRFAVWGQGFGSWGHTDSDGNAAQLARSTGGFFLGGDAPAFDTWRFGAVAGYSRTDFKAKDRQSSGSSDNYYLGLYGGTQWGDLAFRTGAAYSWHDLKSNRSVAIPGIGETLAGGYNAGTFQAFGELSYRVSMGAVRFEPFANLAYVTLHTDGFTEKGGVAALSSQNATTNTSFTTFGLRASTTFDLNGASVTTRGMLGWRHAFGDVTPQATMRFGGAGDAFTVGGVPIARDAAVFETGLDLALSPTATLGVTYGGQFGGGVTDQSFKASFNVKF